MEMTDKQFDGFVRFLLDDLTEVQKEQKEKGSENEKLDKIIDNLQKILED